MAVTPYTYSVSNDIPAQKVSAASLTEEIAASDITIALDSITVVADDLTVIFKDALPTADKTLLDGDTSAPAGGLIGAHTGVAPSVYQEVELADVLKNEDGALATTILPHRKDFYLCDRDILIKTAIVDPAAAVVDYKINTTTYALTQWNEMSLVGCFKDDGAGGFVACTDQADADTNAILSIFDYIAIDQTTGDPVSYDIFGGGLRVDDVITGDPLQHHAFAIAAPDIPVALGGSIRFFDAYVGVYAGEIIESFITHASKMDPQVSPAAAILRLYFRYPAGIKQNHVFRLLQFRPQSSF